MFFIKESDYKKYDLVVVFPLERLFVNCVEVKFEFARLLTGCACAGLHSSVKPAK